MTQETTAILGAGSHIARGLIHHLLQSTHTPLTLYTRSAVRVKQFLQNLVTPLHDTVEVVAGYETLHDGNHDVIVNCIGAGPPSRISGRWADWFHVTEVYDNLALSYLMERSEGCYLNFSSGAVYGSGHTAPVGSETHVLLPVNRFSPPDYYTIALLNAEAKHRSYSELAIVDLRVFSYFSRYAQLDAGYLLTDIAQAIAANRVLHTGPHDILRDYVHPADLFQLLQQAVKCRANAAYDAISLAPVTKSELLAHFTSRCGLRVEVDDAWVEQSPNGTRNTYCPSENLAAEIGYQPTYTSLEAVSLEMEALLTTISPGVEVSQSDGEAAP